MQYFKSGDYPIEILLSENIEKDFETHNHINHYIVSFVLRGKVSVNVNGKLFEYDKDDIYIIPPFVAHSSFQSKDTRIITICIATSFVENTNFDLAKEIVRTLIMDSDVSNFLQSEQTENIINSLEEVFCFQSADNKDFSKEIDTLLDMMISKPESDLSIDELADKIFMSKYHMIRKFKKIIGMTPHQFHIQNRIRKSQHLLNNGKTIAEVSVGLGFYDQSHFNKSFQKIVGISPLEYINSNYDI